MFLGKCGGAYHGHHQCNEAAPIVRSVSITGNTEVTREHPGCRQHAVKERVGLISVVELYFGYRSFKDKRQRLSLVWHERYTPPQ